MRSMLLMVLLDDSFLFNLRPRIIEKLNAAKLPSLFGLRQAVEDGGLMSYGESLSRSHSRAAYFVDSDCENGGPSMVGPATLAKETGGRIPASAPSNVVIAIYVSQDVVSKDQRESMLVISPYFLI